ncbi:hypothetical protein LUZ63_017936 [Rhynchospora breviuscula]|uniref:C2H2-type domain-containing protein n=1 Tax=Rhynchospora breviuscula TaxID=2022672 RepID=A0A9Q0HGL4_9POAL|nr:hypothetical protein LUZ63_017936 [Rhynchospora breviuscula]
MKATNVLLSLSLTSNIIKKSNKRKKNNGVFQCKICNRNFPSFQALGGHCTSHLRPKVRSDGIELKSGEKFKESTTRHICGICGKEFEMGHALGGHMRLHRASPVTPALSQIQPEEDFGFYLLPRLTDEKLGVYIDGDAITEGFQYQRRLLNLFE